MDKRLISPKRVLTPEKVRGMRLMKQELGTVNSTLALVFDVSPSTVQKALSFITYKEIK